MVEPTIDQGLAKIGGGLAIVRRGGRVRTEVQFAYRDARQIADIQASQINARIRKARITGTDIQGSREGMIAQVWGVMTGATGSRKRGDAAFDEAARRDIIVDAGYVGNVNGLGIENGLTACDRSPWRRPGHGRPGVKELEDRGSELAVPRRHQSPRWFKVELWGRQEKADARVYTDKEWLCGERHGSACRAVRVQAPGIIVDDLCGGQGHLEIHNLGLLVRCWP